MSVPIDTYFDLIGQIELITKDIQKVLKAKDNISIQRCLDEFISSVQQLDQLAPVIQEGIKSRNDQKLFKYNHKNAMLRFEKFEQKCREKVRPSSQSYGVEDKPKTSSRRKSCDNVSYLSGSTQFDKSRHTVEQEVSQYFECMSVDSYRSRQSCHSSKGSHSSRHSHSSKSSSMALEEGQKQAELKAKLQMVQEKHRLSLAKADLQRQEEELQLLTDLKASEAKMEVINRMMSPNSMMSPRKLQSRTSYPLMSEMVKTPPRGYSLLREVPEVIKTPTYDNTHVHENLQEVKTPLSEKTLSNRYERSSDYHKKGDSKVNLNPDADVFSPASQLHESKTDTSETSSELVSVLKEAVEQNRLQRLPPPEPPVFDGEPLTYPRWRRAFDSLIAQGIPHQEKIYHLSKYLSDKVKEDVEGYFCQNTEEAFSDAMKLLDERFGNSFIIGEAFRDKIDNWPKIHNRDGRGLRKFADFLRQCLSAMNSISSLQHLNDEREQRKILTKLPDWLISRWARKVVETKENRGSCPTFKELSSFLSREADIACDPATSFNKIQEKHFEKSTDKNNPRSKTSVTVHKTDVTAKKKFTSSTTKTDDSTPTKTCIFCKAGDHIIDNCKKFGDLSKDAKSEYIRSKGICYSCLHFGHISRDCKKRKTCKICGKHHPSILHFDDNEQNMTTTVTTISHFLDADKSAQNTTAIVPVWISHSSNPEKEVLAYAMLDTQSDSSFVLDSIVDDLGIDGVPVNLKLSTMATDHGELFESQKIRGLTVRGYRSNLKLNIPAAYSRDIMPAEKAHIPTPEIARKYPHLRRLSEEIPPLLPDVEIALLLGYNCPQALIPREVISSKNFEPFGQCTDLGWSIIGGPGEHFSTFRTKTKEVISPVQVNKMFELDFNEGSTQADEVSYSKEDAKFIRIVENEVKKTSDKHYELPLPFRGPVTLKSNRIQAEQRLRSTKKKFLKDEVYKTKYTDFMNQVIASGAAEQVHEDEDKENSWYLPHHGVFHPKKPEKIRVVFDASAKFDGQSLNTQLLQGPDLTNNLIGILCRFRQEPIAFSCDVEKMFHQFYVTPKYRDYLRFLWWPEGNFEMEPATYRMTVHVFGAISSPACANFALKKIASDNKDIYGESAYDMISKNFYVDDGLVSVESTEEAIQLVDNVKRMCSAGGLRLHKFASNSEEVLKSISEEDRQSGTNDLLQEHLPTSRALGVLWDMATDQLGFKIALQEGFPTRRGILATVSSVYDPLGFIAPVMLFGKRIVQQACNEQADWDTPVSSDIKLQWEKWKSQLHCLQDLKIPRCLKPLNFGKVKSIQLHHFSDASTVGYSQCSYARFINENGDVHCSFIIGKCRVTPKKQVSIPRLELTAAVVSARVGAMLRKQMDYKITEEYFWTDSKIVLGYIANESRRFRTYVANRVQIIQDLSEAHQWHYVPTSDNPADEGSRGTSCKQLLYSAKWLNGPDFLWKRNIHLLHSDDKSYVDPADPEIKSSSVFATKTSCKEGLPTRLNHMSDWNRIKGAVRQCIILKDKLINKVRKQATRRLGQVAELRRAEIVIFKAMQEEAFSEEIKLLANSKEQQRLPRRSPLFKLRPFLDDEGLIRVGGRLQEAEAPYHEKHPVILPKNSYLTELIVRHHHQRVKHGGRGFTVNKVRTAGIWIIGLSRIVRHVISSCILCRKSRGKVQEQVMAELPKERLEIAPPFTYCCVDTFGPWIVKNARRNEKRYGILFGCLASRAVHIEVAQSLSTDSFINALRRFIAIRGPIRSLHADQGTNFVGAVREIGTLDTSQIEEYLKKEGCDLVVFKFNSPSSSHAGGAWERQIRTVRGVLSNLLKEHGSQLNDEALNTVMYEAAAICNGRPLTTDTLYDPDSLMPLTPNHLLMMKSQVVLPPPGNFEKEDLYSRKYWRRAQYVCNIFWTRWKREYLSSLQERKKWNIKRKNVAIGDIVIIKDPQPRNCWLLGKVIETIKSKDGQVRHVKIQIGDRTLDKQGRRTRPVSILERPIQKLVVLLEGE